MIKQHRLGKTTSLIGLLFFGLLLLSSQTLAQGINLAHGIIIDHSCTDLRQVPKYWINKAKTEFKISYGHTSHGSQIVSGMGVIKGDPGSLYWFDHDGTKSGLSLHDREPSGDLGNPDRETWASRTRSLLDKPDNDRNLIMWSWCGQVNGSAKQINTYLALMNQLEKDYPGVIFVYMTGHLNGSGEDGNVNIRNNQIREFCRLNNKVLFDFADIESYDPDGNYFLDKAATDNCDYWEHGAKMNWAQQWCTAHPGKCSSCYCAHSQSLNCELKGRAFWWMMARLAGWDPSLVCQGDLNLDGEITPQDALIAFSCYLETGPCSECSDVNEDGEVTPADPLCLFNKYLGRPSCLQGFHQ